jgi:hypothetical protein
MSGRVYFAMQTATGFELKVEPCEDVHRPRTQQTIQDKEY